MRKLLLTLAVLCGTVSAWADFTQHYSSNAEHWKEGVSGYFRLVDNHNQE